MFQKLHWRREYDLNYNWKRAEQKNASPSCLSRCCLTSMSFTSNLSSKYSSGFGVIVHFPLSTILETFLPIPYSHFYQVTIIYTLSFKVPSYFIWYCFQWETPLNTNRHNRGWTAKWEKTLENRLTSQHIQYSWNDLTPIENQVYWRNSTNPQRSLLVNPAWKCSRLVFP